MEKQQSVGWGDGVVDQLASDLQAEFPDMRGFSPRNIWDMRRFYSAYSSAEFLAQVTRELTRIPKRSIRPQAAAKQEGISATPEFLRQLVAEIPWGHHLLILNTLPDPTARLYYLRKLQAKLPAEFKGRLPSAKQLADAVRDVLPLRK